MESLDNSGIEGNNLSYPVVGEVLVHYLPHLGLARVQYGGAKIEANIQHGSLVCQRGAPVLWQRVSRNLMDRKEDRMRYNIHNNT